MIFQKKTGAPLPFLVGDGKNRQITLLLQGGAEDSVRLLLTSVPGSWYLVRTFLQPRQTVGPIKPRQVVLTASDALCLAIPELQA